MRPLSILCCLCLLILAGCETEGMREQREAEQRYINSLTPEQFERYDARKMQVLGMFLGSGGFLSFHPSQVAPYQPAVVPSQPAPVRPMVNCVTSTGAAGTSTICY